MVQSCPWSRNFLLFRGKVIIQVKLLTLSASEVATSDAIGVIRVTHGILMSTPLSELMTLLNMQFCLAQNLWLLQEGNH